MSPVQNVRQPLQDFIYQNIWKNVLHNVILAPKRQIKKKIQDGEFMNFLMVLQQRSFIYVCETWGGKFKVNKCFSQVTSNWETVFTVKD